MHRLTLENLPFKTIVVSDVVGDIIMHTKIKHAEQADIWLKAYEKTTNTRWIVRQTLKNVENWSI